MTKYHWVVSFYTTLTYFLQFWRLGRWRSRFLKSSVWVKAFFLVHRLLPQSVFSHVEGARDLSGAPFLRALILFIKGSLSYLSTPWRSRLLTLSSLRIRISSYEFWKEHKYSYYNINLLYKEYKLGINFFNNPRGDPCKWESQNWSVSSFMEYLCSSIAKQLYLCFRWIV